MKKLNQVLCLALAGLVISGVAACAGKGNTNGGKKDEGNTELLIAFDDYKSVRASSYSRTFGEAVVNTDKAYITQGKGSMRVRVEGEWTTEMAYPWITYRTTDDNFLNNDFTSYDATLLDVYNDSPAERHIMLYFIAKNALGASVMTPERSFALAPQSWTTCAYDLSDGSIKQMYSGLTAVESLRISFPDYQRDLDVPTDYFYIDNFRGAVNENAKQTYAPSRTSGMLLDFENEGDFNLISPGNRNAQGYKQSIYEMTQTAISRFVTSGKYAARIVEKIARTSWGSTSLGYPGFGIRIDLTAFTQEELDGASAISFDFANGNALPFIYEVTVCGDDTATPQYPTELAADAWPGLSRTMTVGAFESVTYTIGKAGMHFTPKGYLIIRTANRYIEFLSEWVVYLDNVHLVTGQ